MDALSAEAVDALVQAITALLPATTPALAPTVIAVPSRVAPTGLGGFVGTNPDPEGEIFGRRIEGNVPSRRAPAIWPALMTRLTALSKHYLLPIERLCWIPAFFTSDSIA